MLVPRTSNPVRMFECRITTFCRSNTALIAIATSSEAIAAAAWSNQRSGPLETVVPRSLLAEAVAYKLEERLTRPRRDLQQFVMQYVNGVTPDPPGHANGVIGPASGASRHHVVPSRQPDRQPSRKRSVVTVDCGSTAEVRAAGPSNDCRPAVALMRS